MQTEKSLSIVIPCYNESQTVRVLLERVLAVTAPQWQLEVVVVDDCSQDGTREILREFESRVTVLYQERNGGKGTAVRAGLSRASGEYVLIQDADLEYDPEEIPTLLAQLTQADVVYGSRNLRPRERAGGLVPRLGVWFITKLINVLHNLNLTDVWTCYKLFPRVAADAFLAGGFESELLFTTALARRGYVFKEVPISYHPRDGSQGKKIRYRDGIYAIVVLVIDRIRYW